MTTYEIAYHDNTLAEDELPPLITSTLKQMVFTDVTGRVVVRPPRHAALRPVVSVTRNGTAVEAHFPTRHLVRIVNIPDAGTVDAVINRLNSKLA